MESDMLEDFAKALMGSKATSEIQRRGAPGRLEAAALEFPGLLEGCAELFALDSARSW